MDHPHGPRPVITITDPDDLLIDAYTGLRDHDLRLRRESPEGDLAGVFLAEGDLVVERALRAGYPLLSVLVDATRTTPIPETVPPDTTVFAAGPEVVLRITGMGVHRGMMGVFGRRPLPSAESVLASSTRLVVLEGVVNPTNMGVIARSAAALGADALLLDPASVDPLYRRASRVSMGTVFSLPHARLAPFPAGLDLLHQAGFSMLALSPDPAAPSIDELSFGIDEKVALLLGSEGPGLQRETMASVGRVARIPMHSGVDSLNVAAAAAIACFVLGRGRSESVTRVEPPGSTGGVAS